MVGWMVGRDGAEGWGEAMMWLGIPSSMVGRDGAEGWGEAMMWLGIPSSRHLRK